MAPLDVIAHNFPESEGYSEVSFLGQLHERGYWDEVEYSRLETAVTTLAESPSSSRVALWPAARIFSALCNLFIAHASPSDSYRIEGLDDEAFWQAHTDAQALFERFFRAQGGA